MSTRIRSHMTIALCLGILAFGLWMPSQEPLRADETKGIDWTKVLPEAEVLKLIEESGKALQDFTKSPSNFNLKAKSVENEAYVLLLYAQAGMKSGNDELAKKSAQLREAATALVAAAKKKNLEEAKKQTAFIAGFKTATPGEAKMTDVNVAKEVPIKNLMEEVQALFLRFDNPKKGAYKRLTAAEWGAKGKTEEIATAAHKMAALTVAITAHVPEKDPDAAKGQTRKVWFDTTEGCRTGALDMVTAAKAKNQSDFKKALLNMDKSCTKCHDAYRVDAN